MIVSLRNGVPVTDIDIVGEQFADNPWPALASLREQGPVVWHECYQRWLITTDREVRQTAINFARFTVEGTVVEDLFGRDAFIAMDDRERHNTIRDVWAAAFRPQSIVERGEDIDLIVEALLTPVVERLKDGEAVNLSTALCRPLPTMVIALMMGVPRQRLDDVVQWSDALAGGSTSYVDEARREAVIDRRERAKSALAELLFDLLEQRRQAPLNDLISLMAQQGAAKGFADEQIVQNLRQLLFAGNETTAKWLDHAFLTYGERPEVQREIAADRRLIRAANEEVLRWQGVVGTLPRRVRGGAIVVAGVELAEGDNVTCLLAAANRDPARYNDPDAFSIHRKPQPNLGFGVGLHNCLGSNLARLEVEAAVNALLDNITAYEIAAPYSYSSLPLRGPAPVIISGR